MKNYFNFRNHFNSRGYFNLIFIIVFVFNTKLTISATKQNTLIGSVQYVYDGDTILVASKGKKYKIRLEGIDAPELTQTFGLESKQYLKSLIDGKHIQFSIGKKDKYNRVVSFIHIKGAHQSVNTTMVKQGYAWWYRKYAKNNKALKHSQKQAKLKKRGLWSKYKPIAPWKYKYNNKDTEGSVHE